jgi:hypothetical protein
MELNLSHSAEENAAFSKYLKLYDFVVEQTGKQITYPAHVVWEDNVEDATDQLMMATQLARFTDYVDPTDHSNVTLHVFQVPTKNIWVGWFTESGYTCTVEINVCTRNLVDSL